MRRALIVIGIGAWIFANIGSPALAGSKKSKNPPKPMNQKVKYEAYPGTDIAQIRYLSSRQEFRVGHSPYQIDRFHVAEFVLITKHTGKYLRPDLGGEIKLAPGRTTPALMANKSFQTKFRGLIKTYRDLAKRYQKIKVPRACKTAARQYLAAMQDELALAEAVSKRMFGNQGIRARERLCADLKTRFRGRNPERFDTLCADFEKEANLAAFFPGLVEACIEPSRAKAQQQVEKAMAAVGLEYAEAAEEDGEDIVQ